MVQRLHPDFTRQITEKGLYLLGSAVFEAGTVMHAPRLADAMVPGPATLSRRGACELHGYHRWKLSVGATLKNLGSLPGCVPEFQ